MFQDVALLLLNIASNRGIILGFYRVWRLKKQSSLIELTQTRVI